MPSVPMVYIGQGDILSALSWFLNDYIGYGIMIMFFGILLFVVVQSKTKSFGLSAIVLIVYSGVAGARLPQEIQMYLYLILVIMATVLFLKIIFGKGSQ